MRSRMQEGQSFYYAVGVYALGLPIKMLVAVVELFSCSRLSLNLCVVPNWAKRCCKNFAISATGLECTVPCKSSSTQSWNGWCWPSFIHSQICLQKNCKVALVLTLPNRLVPALFSCSLLVSWLADYHSYQIRNEWSRTYLLQMSPTWEYWDLH